jgi:hypothetical protein
MDMGAGCVIDKQAEQFGTTVVTAGVHERLAFVNQPKVQIGDHLAFTGPQRLAEQFALRRGDCGEAATRLSGPPGSQCRP